MVEHMVDMVHHGWVYGWHGSSWLTVWLTWFMVVDHRWAIWLTQFIMVDFSYGWPWTWSIKVGMVHHGCQPWWTMSTIWSTMINHVNHKVNHDKPCQPPGQPWWTTSTWSTMMTTWSTMINHIVSSGLGMNTRKWTRRGYQDDQFVGRTHSQPTPVTRTHQVYGNSLSTAYEKNTIMNTYSTYARILPTHYLHRAKYDCMEYEATISCCEKKWKSAGKMLRLGNYKNSGLRTQFSASKHSQLTLRLYDPRVYK